MSILDSIIARKMNFDPSAIFKREIGNVQVSMSESRALHARSSSGADITITDIINKELLPEEFLQNDFRHFRVAGKEKVTIDVVTGKWTTGKKVDMPLYSISELEAIGGIPNAHYLQFVPAGTPYTILDFDTDKSLTDVERQDQVSHITEKVLNQFDGCVELSSSGMGIHAYVEDERLKLGLSSDPLKFYITDDKDRIIDVEVFALNAPIILTGNLVEESTFDFDTIPKRLMEAAKINIKTKEITKHENVALSEIQIDKDELNSITERFKKMDAHNRFELGYADADDCSTVDFAVANMLLQATNGNKDQSYSLLLSWMEKWRPKSNCKKTSREIKNKANRAINSGYKKLLTENPIEIQKNKPFENQGKTTWELIMRRKILAQNARMAMAKSRSLARNVIYEGTLNVIYAKSGSGKSKMAVMLTMEIAKSFPDKIIYYFGADLSNDDIIEIAKLAVEKGLNNFVIDQDATGTQFMELIGNIPNTEDAHDLVFVVDTLKKIVSVNNKDGMSKTFSTIKRATSRGATGIIVAHTNKDGETISGTAEVEQDSDNVLTVATEYIGEDQMKVTIMASELRCRSRIEPLTIVISRDGFEYEISDQHVNMSAIEAQEKEFERMGNIIEIAQDVVNEYAEKSGALTKTQLKEEIRDADAYTGNRKNDILSKMIDKMGENLDITLTKEGRSILCTPYIHTVQNLLKGFNNDGTSEEGNDDTK